MKDMNIKKPKRPGYPLIEKEKIILDTLAHRFDSKFVKTEYNPEKHIMEYHFKIINISDLKKNNMTLKKLIDQTSKVGINLCKPIIKVKTKAGTYILQSPGNETLTVFSYISDNNPKHRWTIKMPKYLGKAEHEMQANTDIYPKAILIKSKAGAPDRINIKEINGNIVPGIVPVIKQKYSGPSLNLLKHTAETKEEQDLLESISQKCQELKLNLCYDPRKRRLMRVDQG